jgi:hypothetical protein
MKKLFVLLMIISTSFGLGVANTNFHSTNTMIAPQSAMVLICVSPTASKFHAYSCWGLQNCTHDINSVSKENAISTGYSPCGICYK